MVVDMQNDFCSPEGQYASVGRDVTALTAVVPAVRRVIELAREHDVPVIYTKLVYDDDHGAIEARHALKPARWTDSGRRLISGTWGAEIVDEVKPAPNDLVIQKHSYSAFEGTNLEHELNVRGITTLAMCGVVTYACVLSSMFSAFDKGFDVCLVSDASGSWKPTLGESSSEIVELLLGAVVETSQLEFSAAR